MCGKTPRRSRRDDAKLTPWVYRSWPRLHEGHSGVGREGGRGILSDKEGEGSGGDGGGSGGGMKEGGKGVEWNGMGGVTSLQFVGSK